MAEEKDADRPEGQGFLASWSRRKRAAAKAESIDTDESALDAGAEAEAAGDPLPEHAPEAEPELDAEALAALPPIDEITGATDLTPFLQRGVPKALRKAAMRKVWLSNKLICDHDDPAVDYAWDWNAPDGVPGSGGTLSKDSVAKMFDDLFRPNRPLFDEAETNDGGDKGAGAHETPMDGSLGADRDTEDAVPDETQDAGSVGDAGAATAPPEKALPSDPVRKAGDPVARDAQDAQSAAAARAEIPGPSAAPAGPSPTPSTRRHGGAVPE